MIRTTALLLPCLACIGLGRRVQRAYAQNQGSIGGPSASEAFATLLLASNPATAWQLASQGHLRSFALERPVVSRARTVDMKTRGPKNKPKQTGFDAFAQRMMQKDEKKDEWVMVINDTDLGAESGATLAVEAGVDPKGRDLIWTLVRGDPQGTEYEDRADQKSIFAIDGTCRCCLFPMTAGKAAKDGPDGTWAMTCGLCGTKYALEDRGQEREERAGEILDFLPGDNPVRWVQKNLNKDKPNARQVAAVLPIRISPTGRVRVRLPDGTLVKGKNYPSKADLE